MTAPCTGPRPAVLEADVEDAVVEWAENNDWLVRKMRFIGRRGCPDRYFYGYGHIVMIEFKRPNGTLSETGGASIAAWRTPVSPSMSSNTPRTGSTS